MSDNVKVKQTVKDSVFTNLFGNPKYLLQLYQALHPEDANVKEEEFFGGEKVAIEVTVKMIYDGEKGDIINQYVSFTRVLNEQVKKHGRTRAAVRETIRICKNCNVLKEYFEKTESEVVNIMMQLYNQEEVMRLHILNERRDSGIMNVVAALKGIGLSFAEVVNKIAEQFSLTQERAEREVSEYWNE